MNREDIIRMAFEAYGDAILKSVQDFAAFAYDKGVEAEREACAKVCEKEYKDYDWADREQEAAEDCAKAIRARGQTK